MKKQLSMTMTPFVLHSSLFTAINLSSSRSYTLWLRLYLKHPLRRKYCCWVRNEYIKYISIIYFRDAPLNLVSLDCYSPHLQYNRTYTGKMASAVGTKSDSSVVTCNLSASMLDSSKRPTLLSVCPGSTQTSHAITIRYGDVVQDVECRSAKAGFLYEYIPLPNLV